MAAECIEHLVVNPDGVYVDVTFGGGGHSQLILNALSEKGRLFGFDQDEDAQKNNINDPRFVLIPQNFRHLKRFLKVNGISQVDGILADLGISSHQINEAERGFSFRFDAKIDMRMNQSSVLTAEYLLNNASEDVLGFVFKEYGEISKWWYMTRAIIEARKAEPFNSTVRLKEVVLPFKGADKESKFLAKVFQAIRIYVNDEIEALKEMLEQSNLVLKENGRLVVMSYHSLEDRLVKNFIRFGKFDDKAEKDFFGNLVRPFKPLTTKAIVPSETEQLENTRSRSAKLRVGIKLI